MDNSILIIISIAASVVGVLLGMGGTIFYNKKMQAEKATQIIKDAEAKGDIIVQEKTLQAKERFLQLKAEHEKTINEKNAQILSGENRIKQKEGTINARTEELKKKETEVDKVKDRLHAQLEINTNKQEEIEKLHKRQVQQLEVISGLKQEEAKNQLVEALKAEARTDALSHIKEIVDEAKLTASKEAKKIVIQTIQRVATEHAIENSVTVFNIESDEVKGRIIGREGRNIRALEAATGIEIIVDDTPEAIILSGFDPIKREIARLALHQLVTDGRIHPARVEEVVAKTTKKLEDEIVEIGKRTTIDLGIHGLHPELNFSGSTSFGNHYTRLN